MVGLVTLLLNVPTKEIQIVTMKTAARKTKGIQRTRKEIMEGMTRTKTSIQRRTTTHLMMMTQIVTMNPKGYSSWLWMQNKLLKNMLNQKKTE